ncbi:MAG: hypothetical protein IKA71_06500 [Lentisphaeria bacterium]|nr:hypothetical protein [Lentisphaeria bacterium]
MKKFMFLLTVCFSICTLSAAEVLPYNGEGSVKDVNWGEKFALYLPNRILDALDMFSVSLGIGPVVEARLMGTRLADVGAGYSATTFKLYKAHNRQYGIGMEDGWYWSFIFVGEEEFCVRDGSLLVDKFVECRAGVPTPEMRVYDYFEGPRDFWAIGGSLGLGIDGDLYIHPVEWVDFALGFLMIDIRCDDLTFDSFNR